VRAVRPAQYRGRHVRRQYGGRHDLWHVEHGQHRSGSGIAGSGSMVNRTSGMHLRVNSVRMISADCSGK